MNVKMSDQTPGTELAAFGTFAQRSGLEKKKNRSDNQIRTKSRTKPT